MRVVEESMGQRQNERAGGKGRFPRKSVNRGHRSARFPHVKIREGLGRGLKPVVATGSALCFETAMRLARYESWYGTCHRNEDVSNYQTWYEIWPYTLACIPPAMVDPAQDFTEFFIVYVVYANFQLPHIRVQEYHTALSSHSGIAAKHWSCRVPGTMPSVCGFSRGSPFSPAPSFQCCSILASITLDGSEDVHVKSRPNLFTHYSLTIRSSPIEFSESLGYSEDATGRRVFSGTSRFSPAPSFRRRSILASVTLNGSQDLADKSHPISSLTHFLGYCIYRFTFDWGKCELAVSISGNNYNSADTVESSFSGADPRNSSPAHHGHHISGWCSANSSSAGRNSGGGCRTGTSPESAASSTPLAELALRTPDTASSLVRSRKPRSPPLLDRPSFRAHRAPNCPLMAHVPCAISSVTGESSGWYTIHGLFCRAIVVLWSLVVASRRVPSPTAHCFPVLGIHYYTIAQSWVFTTTLLPSPGYSLLHYCPVLDIHYCTIRLRPLGLHPRFFIGPHPWARLRRRDINSLARKRTVSGGPRHQCVESGVITGGTPFAELSKPINPLKDTISSRNTFYSLADLTSMDFILRSILLHTL
ncbi:hypothetical protein PR048_031606 [Dryococelus australis]|uniref:Uncharacterized protein n=1 Tax=Dryococelus australis TaxID=614101 RepID=A0ABQ9G5S1_9NEOP|nr:hypothetical protein PR048_031606 [Dryococelus australis]